MKIANSSVLLALAVLVVGQCLARVRRGGMGVYPFMAGWQIGQSVASDSAP